MFKKEERTIEVSRSDGAATTTIVGHGTRFNGVLKVEGSLRVEGELEGEVHVSQGLVVGTGGVIKAELAVDSAVIAGRVVGQLRAKGKVLLQRGSRMEGDVHASTFQIEDGAFFQGNCTMGEGAAPPSATRRDGEGEQDLKIVRS